jgi:hypothetical protein
MSEQNLDRLNFLILGPLTSCSASAYAFGARDFDVKAAPTDMAAEATSANDIRPGNATVASKGYLPYDGSYGCCNFYGPVSA